MEGFHLAVILVVFYLTYIKADFVEEDLAVSIEDRVNALETQVVVQSMKNRQAITRMEKKLLQKIETKNSFVGDQNSDPNIVKRVDELEKVVDKVMKLVGASVKGFSHEKVMNRQKLKHLTEDAGSFRESTEKRIDTLEGKLNLQSKANESLVSMIEYLNRTIKELKSKDIQQVNKDLGQTVKPRLTDCPDRWIRIENTCFLLVDDERVDWFSASLKCHEMDATLAEIKDGAMFDRLVQNMTTYTWVGGTDEEVEGKWIWIGSNTEITYFNWVKDQPNSLADDQDCLEIWPFHRGFNDEACEVGGNYLCQKDLDRF